MKESTLLILTREDLPELNNKDPFDSIHKHSFSDDVCLKMKDFGMVLFKDEDWQTKILTSKYGVIENLKVSKWQIFDF